MALEQNVMAQLKTAMLAKDEASLRGLRAIKAAIILAKTSEGAGGELSRSVAALRRFPCTRRPIHVCTGG